MSLDRSQWWLQFFDADNVYAKKRGEAIAIITRKERLWGLPRRPGIIRYSLPHRPARLHLTPESPGGRPILKHLLRRYGGGLVRRAASTARSTCAGDGREEPEQ